MNAPAHTSAGIRSALEYVQGVFGPNFFPINEGRSMAWSDQLRELTDAQLIEGVRRACSNAQRGQPPMPADILAAIHGRWTIEPRKATDCHGNVTPDSPIARFQVLRSHDGAVIRCLDEKLNLVDYATQNHIMSRERLLREFPNLLPPGELAKIQAIEGRSAGRADNHLADRPNFGAGLLGQ